jgi:hypothetical protein
VEADAGRGRQFDVDLVIGEKHPVIAAGHCPGRRCQCR